MRLLSNPVAQFLAAAGVVVLGVAFATDRLSHRAAEEEAVTDARVTTELLAHSVVEPLIPAGLSSGSAEAVAELDESVRDRVHVDDVERVKIWNEDGVVVYSDEPGLIGEQFTLSPAAREVLSGGESGAGVSDLRRQENRFELERGGLLEVYTRIESPEGEPLLFEVYYTAQKMQESTEAIFSEFRPITVGGPVALGLVTVPLLWALTRRVDRSARARERLLRSAARASEEERRRIAHDLHQGPVSSLADAADLLAAEARDGQLAPDTAHRLRAVGDSLRHSVRGLRTLVVEIYPPDLDADGLGPALEDLVAPAGVAGLRTRVEVSRVHPVSDSALAVVWRVAREAVRNTVRHARATRLDLHVSREGSDLVLTVADNGVGFVPGAFSSPGSFGLRAASDIARESGGRLDVDSGPGRGTVVRLVTPV